MEKTKRKRIVLTIKDKLDIIKRRDKGNSIGSLARDYKIGIQTVRDIVKSKSKLEDFVCKSDSFAHADLRRTVKESTYKDLDRAMAKWFLQKRSEGVPISGPMCAQQAEQFHQKLNIEGTFSASSGWLHRFKQRYGIRDLAIQGERLSADEVAMVDFCYNLENIIKDNNFTNDQIYNADETGLYWKAVPTRTLAMANEKDALGFKLRKDRITVLCCANASGNHKLKLTVVGKAKKPRAFKNINMNFLPVNYYAQQAAWMNRDIFKNWFFKKFVPEVRLYFANNNLPAKAILLLDNAPFHPAESVLRTEDGNIFVLFFPPNVTSIAQPMDQGVIEAMKRYYRRNMMIYLLEYKDMNEFWKNFSLKDSINRLANAWSRVKPTHIERSLFKIMTLSETEPAEALDQDVTVGSLS